MKRLMAAALLMTPALVVSQDNGEFTVGDAIRSLGESEQVAFTVASIIRNEWEVLPEALFDGLSEKPTAAVRLLDYLARAPRPMAHAWVVRQSLEAADRSAKHRLLALAARNQPLSLEEAQFLLLALVQGDAGDGSFYAAAMVSEKIADRLVGRVHQQLMQPEVEVEQLGILLDRLSSRGMRALLGLAVTLPEGKAHQLLRRVNESRPNLVASRVAAALDGKIPLDPLWLNYTGSLLDRQSRIDAVVAIMLEGNDETARATAFRALLDAKAADPRMLKWLLESGDSSLKIGAVTKLSNQLPTDYVLGCLRDAPEVVAAMARGLDYRSALEPEIQEQLLSILEGFATADHRTPRWALTALVQKGSRTSLEAAWQLMMSGDSWPDLLKRLGGRKDAFLTDFLQSRIAALEANGNAPDQDVHRHQLATLRLLLAARGDDHCLDEVVRIAPECNLVFLRSCRHRIDTLSVDQATSLCERALKLEDLSAVAEIFAWMSDAQAAVADEFLWKIWNDPSADLRAEELREIAVPLLVLGPHREELFAALRDALDRGPLDPRMSSLPYEALNSMAKPLGQSDVLLCAQLILEMPLGDAASERQQVKRWPDGSFGFPLVVAAANRLRGVDPLLAERVFSDLVDELVEDPRSANISRQRLLVFWQSLSVMPDLQKVLGRLTCPLWANHKQARLQGADLEIGVAHYLHASQAELDGDFEQAELLYRKAGRELLRSSSSRSASRWFLGERDAELGEDPLSRLAAAPYRMRLLAALAAGDDKGILKASMLVREFAGRDRETIDSLKGYPPQSIR